MSTFATIECTLDVFKPSGSSACSEGTGIGRQPAEGRVPRIARLMALALRFERLVREGAVGDYAELATLGHVNRARITQIMNLLHLAPDLQEQLLFLAPVKTGRDPISLEQLLPLTAILDWRTQRRRWKEMQQRGT
jgi:hypothetical protein